MKKLFRLVNGLTMNEKRYFKTHVKSAHALELFDIINSQNRDTSMLRKYSSREKNYLLNSIYRTLRDFHNEVSINRVLDNYVHDIDILINKEMYDLAKDRIKLGEKLAVKHEKLHHQVIFMRLYKRIERNIGADVFESNLLHRKKINELIELENIEYKLSDLITQYREKAFVTKDFDIINEVEKITSSLSPEQAIKVKAGYPYMRILGFVNFDKRRIDESYSYYIELRKKFEEKVNDLSNSTLDNYSLINYLTMLHGYLSVLKERKSEKEFYEVISILKKFNNMQGKESMKIFVNMAMSLTDFFLRKNEIKRGVQFLEENKEKIESVNDIELDRMELLNFNAAYLYFLDKRFRTAHKYIYKYVSYPIPKYKIVYKAANFVYILNQIEMGKIDFAITFADKYLKKMKSENMLTDFDELLVQFVKNYFMIESKNKSLKTYNDLVENIRMNSGKFNLANLNRYFNFKGWMESKLFKIPFNTSTEGIM